MDSLRSPALHSVTHIVNIRGCHLTCGRGELVLTTTKCCVLTPAASVILVPLCRHPVRTTAEHGAVTAAVLAGALAALEVWTAAAAPQQAAAGMLGAVGGQWRVEAAAEHRVLTRRPTPAAIVLLSGSLLLLRH